MMGLLPTDVAGEAVRLSFFWSIRGDRDAEWKEGDLDAWKRHVLNLWPEAAPVVSQIRRHDDLAFAKYRHTWPRTMGSGPLCVVGDAGHAMSPQLGLGTTLAMEDALALAYAVEQCGAEGAAREYSSQRLRRSQRFHTLSRLLTPCVQAQGQGLWRDVAFATGLHIPGVPWLMKRSLAAPARPHPVETTVRAPALPSVEPSGPAPLA
jgi:2-polyprenyl-6-methoxyphenol hydroxylase-like FAD-dependent oxidoreductase